MDNWKTFCSGYPNSTTSDGELVSWLPQLQDFSDCFHDVFLIVTHTILLVAFAYLLGMELSRRTRLLRTARPSWNYRKSWVLRILAATVVFLTLSVRQVILLSYSGFRKELGLSSDLQHGIAIGAWLLFVLQSCTLLRTANPLADKPPRQLGLFFIWLPVFAAYVFELWSGIGGVFLGMPQVYRICAYILFVSQMLILISFVAPIAYSSVRDENIRDLDPLLGTTEATRPSIANTYDEAWWISKLLLWWANGLISNGSFLKTTDDLFNLPREVEFTKIGEKFRRHLADDPKTTKFYLVRVLFGIWGLRWIFAGFLALLSVAATYATPVLLQKLVAYFESETALRSEGYMWAGLMIASNIFSALFHTHYRLFEGKLSMSVVGVLVDSVYRKLFHVYGADLSDKEVSGKVVNLIGTDCGRINDGLLMIHEVWSMPLQIIIALYLLYLQVGLAFLGGIGVVVVLMCLNQLLVTRILHYEESKQAASDKRIKTMQEILNCIRIIKFHAWEVFFQRRASVVRETELEHLWKIQFFTAFECAMWQVVPVGMAVVTFLIYILLGNQLTAAKVFTSIAIFRILNAPLMMSSWAVIQVIETWVSLKRVQEFFKLPDVSPLELYTLLNPSHGLELDIKDANFSWQTSQQISNDDPEPVIENITVQVKQGEFIGVTGKTGAGKSVFLNSLVGELYKTSGTLGIGTNIFENGWGYAPQEPWIFQGTVRANILFGTPEIQYQRYQDVLEACDLKTDLENWPSGDNTEIGERGVTLSGGQKARISLARAVYQDKPIILLDDPLAAVDPHVAAAIYRKCILGVLRKKTRILVTHNVDCLRQCDRVIMIREGKMDAEGSPDEILALPEVEENQHSPRRKAFVRRESVKSRKSYTSDEGDEDEEESEEEELEEAVPLIGDEERASGVVKPEVYVSYCRAAGWLSMVALICFAVLNQGFVNACDLWMSYWISGNYSTTNDSTGQKEFLSVYGGIAAGATATSLIWPFILFFAGLKAARTLHTYLLASLLRARMQFFDSTPSGRIVNRFSKDIGDVDEVLPIRVLIFLAELCGVIGTFFVLSYSLPWFVAILVPVCTVYYFIQKYYRNTSRELKRLNAVTLSPLYSLYGETIHGLSTIRSMHASDRFCDRFSGLLLNNQRVQFAMMGAEQWLELRLELMGTTLITGVLVIGFIINSQSAAVGLALSYSLSIVDMLSALVDCFINVEKSMVAVERIKQYTDGLEYENIDGPLTTRPDWPTTGEIDIQDLFIRYRPDLPDVLTDINLKIKSGEKVGIVGRTGAGKSSLMLALFRMIEARSGNIQIDGVKISYLNLQHLRSHLTIIPQTPCLFDASIRENLDPLESYQDDQVWEVVDVCRLKPLVEKLGGSLSGGVGENGRNLSAGEKQLVSLARALLSKSKIICLDEATANIDFETDLLVQQTIRQFLSSSTILTIAHRVQTVLDCDRIVVMSDGRISEMGTPDELMQRPDSRFFQLVQQSKSVGDRN